MTTTMELVGQDALQAEPEAAAPAKQLSPEELAALIDRTALLPIPPIQIVRDSGVHSEVCRITPEIARALLTHRRFQREPSWAAVRRYVRDMQAGKWGLTGQPLILSGANGWKIEGDYLYLQDDQGGFSEIEAEDMQHRLLAIYISGITIIAVVTWGISPSVRPLIDLGKVRTLPDVLNYAESLGISAGTVNTKTLATVARRMQQVEYTWAGQRPLTPTVSESMDWLHGHIEMIESVNLAESYRDRLPELGKPDITALVGYHLRAVAGEEAEQSFATKFATQAELPESHPYIVAKTVLGKMAAKANRADRGTWRDHFRIVLNAANLALTDRHPVTEALVKAKPQGRSVPDPITPGPRLGSVEE